MLPPSDEDWDAASMCAVSGAPESSMRAGVFDAGRCRTSPRHSSGSLLGMVIHVLAHSTPRLSTRVSVMRFAETARRLLKGKAESRIGGVYGMGSLTERFVMASPSSTTAERRSGRRCRPEAGMTLLWIRRTRDAQDSKPPVMDLRTPVLGCAGDEEEDIHDDEDDGEEDKIEEGGGGGGEHTAPIPIISPAPSPVPFEESEDEYLGDRGGADTVARLMTVGLPGIVKDEIRDFVSPLSCDDVSSCGARSSSRSGLRHAPLLASSSACGHTTNIDVDATSLIPAKDSSRSSAFSPRHSPSPPSRSPSWFPIDLTSTLTLRSHRSSSTLSTASHPLSWHCFWRVQAEAQALIIVRYLVAGVR
ncbi:hypothetical protein R3P38DRAFT_3252135 [Favolaschia claudopus]|uniref:Kinesin motor domain-containing protein n=1 Tax=Favolaschia claudopus TaxID=2862362 RepID=A0AAW0E7N3_9AGAR